MKVQKNGEVVVLHRVIVVVCIANLDVDLNVVNETYRP
ncbi:hypothetical protein PALB_23390 [Pseudoalteromonas luteoviolacea B = ATCC 29581]|nr:hypothetical protein PALB_23390 [Pseudoalteromonas luteoviolacea B = ATCC 29581]